MLTVLLTDGEFTGMIRSLREIPEIRIVGICFSENAAHTAMLDSSYVAPAWDSPEYLPFLLDIIKKEHVDIVFPVVTNSLPYMASVAGEIHEKTGALVVTSPFTAISKANDKAALFSALKSNLETSEYITEYKTASSVSELCSAVHSFQERNVHCITKPVTGENKEGFLDIISDSEWTDRFLAGEASGTSCPAQLEALDKSLVLPTPRLIMPYLPGQEWDVDLLITDGSIISATIRKNHYMFGGLSACTETADDMWLLTACRSIVRVLGLEYLACISFKEDADGKLKLLEINPRAMGSIHVSSLGGNSLVKRLIDILTGKDSDHSLRITAPGLKTSLYYDIIPLPLKGDQKK